MTKRIELSKIIVDLLELEHIRKRKSSSGKYCRQADGFVLISDIKDYFFREFGIHVEKIRKVHYDVRMSELPKESEKV